MSPCCTSIRPPAGDVGQKERKPTHDPVELAPLIPLRPAEIVLALARAELAEVLGRLGDDVREELDLDPSEWFSWKGVLAVDGVLIVT